MAECTKRELYDDLRAITEHQKSKFLVYSDSSCIVITRSRELARVITSKSVVEISVHSLAYGKINYICCTAGRIRTGVLDNFVNINYLRNFYVSRVTYLTTPRSAPAMSNRLNKTHVLSSQLK
jgi:hypothetical protein